MKFAHHSLTLCAMLILGSATFMGGCATTGMDRAANTSNSIQEVDNELRKMVLQIDVTGASLDSLVKVGQPDLRKSFDIYSDNVAKLDSDGKRVMKRMDEMKTKSIEYFSEWEKTGISYTNPQIRELSEERRLKLAEMYAQVPAAGAGVKVAYLAYLTNLKEIQRYLSNDLTPRGVETITPVANKSMQELEVLKESLKPVITALDQIKAELYSGKK
jgi:hypothetical protein